MNKQILAKIKIRTLTKMLILGLFLSLGGSCSSSDLTGNYRGEAILVVKTSDGTGSQKIYDGETVTDSNMTISLDSLDNLEIKHEKLAKNCKFMGKLNAEKNVIAINLIDSYPQCEFIVNGISRKLEKYNVSGQAVLFNDEATINLSVHTFAATDDYLFYFKGKRAK